MNLITFTKEPGQLNTKLLVLLLVIPLIGIIVGMGITTLPPLMPSLVVAGVLICLITLVRTDLGLAVLILSMLLSPEIKLVQLSRFRAVVIRVDDILIFVVFFTWLAKVALKKEKAMFRKTPLNLPIALYVAACLLFTGKGIIVGDVKPLMSVFYILKYIEFFILFFMFSNNIKSREQLKIFILIFLITGAIICAYTTFQVISGVSRTTAPFEGEKAEPNSLAGYLLFFFAIAAGLFLYSHSPASSVVFGALACSAIVPFLFSLSRGGYLGFVCMYLALLILSGRKKLLLVTFLALALLLGPLILPTKVINRVESTFIPGKEFEFLGEKMTLDTSSSQRVEAWIWLFEQWQKKPFFGYGVTGVGMVDNHYAMVLGDVGIVGFMIFIWMLVTIFINGWKTFRTIDDNYFKGLTLGFMAGFVGLLVQAMTGNVFIIVRIMEPFMFMTAVVMSLPNLFFKGPP